MFDVWRVCKLLSVRLGRTLGGRAASSAAPQQLQAAAVAGPLWGERQIEQQAVRQHGDVIQVAKGGAGAPAVSPAVAAAAVPGLLASVAGYGAA